MHRAKDPLAQLLDAQPEKRESLRPYVARAKSFRNECGCAMGGIFFAASLGFLILRCVFFSGFQASRLFIDVLWGAAFVMAASAFGKLTGMGIARLRLALLYRRLRIGFSLEDA